MDNTYFKIKINKIKQKNTVYENECGCIGGLGLNSLFFLINYIEDKLCAHHLRIFSA